MLMRRDLLHPVSVSWLSLSCSYWEFFSTYDKIYSHAWFFDYVATTRGED